MESDDTAPPPMRLMNFVSQDELDQARQTRGEHVEDGTAQRDRPLYEILRENKEKKDAEFNERFKHRPPKALDEDETEFLERLEMSRKEYERQQAIDEAEQLRCFQEAVAARSVHEINDISPVIGPEEQKPITKKNQNARRPLVMVTVKPQAKKVKTENSASEKPLDVVEDAKQPDAARGALGCLVSYSDESEED